MNAGGKGMSWNDEFDKEHEKKHNFLEFPEKENSILNNNEEQVETNMQKTEPIDIPGKMEQSFLDNENMVDENTQEVFHSGEESQFQTGSVQNPFVQTSQYQPSVESSQDTFEQSNQYQPQMEGNQNILKQTGQYQPSVESSQNTFNQSNQYQPQLESSQNTFHQSNQYQPHVEGGQNTFNQPNQYQPQGVNNQNTFNYGGQYQPQGGNGQNTFNYGGEYQPQGNMAGQRYSKGKQTSSPSGLAIASFVVGLISVLISCCFGGVLGFVSLILGIVSLVRKENGKGFSIAGIILSVISILITILTVMLMVIGWISTDEMEGYDDIVSNIEAVSGTGEDIFEGKAFVGIDQSEICFDSKDGYVYYLDRSEHKNNRYQGTYTYYNGEEAASYLAKDILSDLKAYKDVSALEEAFSGVKNCKQDELYCLVLDVEKRIMDGQTQDGGEELVYFGYYQNALLDVINTSNFKEIYYVPSSEDADDGFNEDKIEKKKEK